MTLMRQLLKWFMVIGISLILVVLSGYLLLNVILPATEHLWLREGEDITKISGRFLIFVVGGVLLFSASVL